MQLKSKRKICRIDEGYTLIEVIVSVQIFLLLLSFGYTLQFYALKFVNRWKEKNVLRNTELLLRTTISHEIGSAKEILEIHQDRIIYLDYELNRLHWSEDKLYVKFHLINPREVTIRIKEMLFINSKHENKFDDLDNSKDGFLISSEFADYNMIKIIYIISLKNIEQSGVLFQKLPDIKQLYF
jgi:prepilin-type N-terminal cleavage/methylation domain-containing protein